MGAPAARGKGLAGGAGGCGLSICQTCRRFGGGRKDSAGRCQLEKKQTDLRVVSVFFFFFLIIYLIYRGIFLAALGLCCCMVFL